MSKAELQDDKETTYNALVRMIESGRTQTAAFRKLTQRLEWVNNEMEKAQARLREEEARYQVIRRELDEAPNSLVGTAWWTSMVEALKDSLVAMDRLRAA